MPGYFWSRDGRYLLYVQDHDGDENFNVYAIDPAEAPASGREVPPTRNITDAKGARAEIYELRQDSYIEIAGSRFFPILTSGVLADFIEQSTTRGQTAALSAFRGWVRNRKSDPEKPV